MAKLPSCAVTTFITGGSIALAARALAGARRP
jgi:hypothetical protein